MIAAGALVLGAVLVAWVAPAALHRLTHRGRDPVAAIICWLASIVAVLATFAIGAGLLLLPGDRPTGLVANAVHDCWAVLHDKAPALDEAAGAAAAALVVVLTGRFGYAAARGRRARRRAYRAHLGLLGVAGTPAAASSRVLWLNHPQPLAYTVGGAGGLVVASTGLRQLPAGQMAAVLCHERAHLRGRHQLLISVTRALAMALPPVPLFRRAPAAIHLLVELAADAAAVRTCGPRAVEAAILALDGGTGPDHALAMTGADITSRLSGVARCGRRTGVLRRATTRTGAALGMAVTPAVVGLGPLSVVVTVWCPGG